MSAGTAYSKRYGAGFVDLPTKTTPIDQQFLNAVEAALLQLIGSAPTADGQVAQWDNANTRFGPALLLNKNIDPAAAIAKSKIDLTGANGIVNADIAPAAAIARSKLNFGSGLVDADIAASAAIAGSKLAVGGLYRKTNAKPVNTTVAETDLLNGEITVGAGALGTTGMLRLTAWGDFLNNVGAFTRPQFKLKLGGTTLIDIGAGASTTGSPARFGWRVVAEIMNTGAANAQLVNMVWRIGGMQGATGTGVNAPTTGEGLESYVYLNGTGIFFVGEAFNTAAKDTSGALALALTVTNASANALYETKLFGAVVEVI